MVQNKSLILARRPVGHPVAGKDLVFSTSDFDLDAPPPEGGVVLKTNYVSYDPYQRGRMDEAEEESWRWELNSPLDNSAIATVISSDNPGFKAGDVVLGFTQFSEYQVLTKTEIESDVPGLGLRVLNNPLGLDVKVFLGALGMPGLTAYSFFYEIAKPFKKGDVIFISAASGAVGQIVGQLAKREGLKVLGSVGSDEKLKFIKEELGFDGGFNYKKGKAIDLLKKLLAEIDAPGLDVVFDNVGGEQLEAAITTSNTFAKLVLCGSLSQYNLTEDEMYGVRNLPLVDTKRLTMRGFLVTDPDMGPRYSEEHQANMQKWIKDGEVIVKMSVTEGIDNAATGLVGIFKGENFGKAILKIADI